MMEAQSTARQAQTAASAGLSRGRTPRLLDSNADAMVRR
jgi:hypothetical protein